ncbi:MAG: toll/interleukin-1 receptor domain-containing protein [Rubrivivax sp.]|nr:toll/interleukin-1 receptor domain-containing protein [Rubrivivax sp.]
MSDADADRPLRLFVSYSHRDEADRERFGVHLAALEAERYYEVWHDRKLGAGQDWAKEIDRHLAEADVVVLLVSADLINSRYVWGIELEQALRQEAAGKTRIVSVILKPCRWQRPFSPLAKRQALPPKLDRVRSVSEHPGGKEKAFDEVMEGLERLCEDVRAQRRHAGSAATASLPAEAAGRLSAADRVRLWVGRHRAVWTAAAGAGALAMAAAVVHGQLGQVAAEGRHLLRIGEYVDAEARFARARWWPGLDDHGAEVARLGRMLPRLGDERVRREFDRALGTLDRAAPGSAFVKYLQGVARFDDWRLAGDAQAGVLFAQMQALYREAALADPALAEAHAGLALAASVECRLDDALAAIEEAERAAGSPPPARYAVQRAEVLGRFDDPAKRAEAMQVFETRGHDPRARLLQAMLAWQSGQWALGRDKVADALAGIDRSAEAGAWLLHAPGGPWLVGDADAKRCLLRYAGAVAGRVGDAAAETHTWAAVARDCPRITEDAREYLCAHLPEQGAAQARDELRCPQPQPRAVCATPRAGTETRPAGTPRT